MKKAIVPILLVLWLIVALFGCTSNSSNGGLTPPSKFKLFIGKFKMLALPVEIRAGRFNERDSRELDSADNTFIKYKDPGKLYAYGMLPDTAESYKIIWLQPADDYIPILTTFTKTGKKISQEYIGIGQCGPDCCYSCTEYMIIKKDLSIYTVDSIKSCECDSTGPKENTMSKTMLYKTGRILSGGKIKLSEVKQKLLDSIVHKQ